MRAQAIAISVLLAAGAASAQYDDDDEVDEVLSVTRIERGPGDATRMMRLDGTSGQVLLVEGANIRVGKLAPVERAQLAAALREHEWRRTETAPPVRSHGPETWLVANESEVFARHDVTRKGAYGDAAAALIPVSQLLLQVAPRLAKLTPPEVRRVGLLYAADDDPTLGTLDGQRVVAKLAPGGFTEVLEALHGEQVELRGVYVQGLFVPLELLYPRRLVNETRSLVKGAGGWVEVASTETEGSPKVALRSILAGKAPGTARVSGWIYPSEYGRPPRFVLESCLAWTTVEVVVGEQRLKLPAGSEVVVKRGVPPRMVEVERQGSTYQVSADQLRLEPPPVRRSVVGALEVRDR